MIECELIDLVPPLNKYEIFNQCCLNDGPSSATLAHH